MFMGVERLSVSEEKWYKTGVFKPERFTLDPLTTRSKRPQQAGQKGTKKPEKVTYW